MNRSLNGEFLSPYCFMENSLPPPPPPLPNMDQGTQSERKEFSILKNCNIMLIQVTWTGGSQGLYRYLLVLEHAGILLRVEQGAGRELVDLIASARKVGDLSGLNHLLNGLTRDTLELRKGKKNVIMSPQVHKYICWLMWFTDSRSVAPDR